MSLAVLPVKRVRIASWSNVLPTRTCLAEGQDGLLLDRLGQLDRPFIGRGAGRSFGDAAYVTDGLTILSKRLRAISSFNPEEGTVVCESGVQMVDLFTYLEGSGWSFPVGGGTRWVSIGGAVAADIHGKNDVQEGSFGNHVEAIEVVTGAGERVVCSRTAHPDLFGATIGGMGLTGFIVRVTLRLQRGRPCAVQEQTTPFSTFEELQGLFGPPSDFQVAWMDLTVPRWRGLFYRGRYVPDRVDDRYAPIEWSLPSLKVFRRPVVRMLNAARYAQQRRVNRITHVLNVHYPVDLLKHWNRLYGPCGFHEYQFAVPEATAPAAFQQFISACRRCGLWPSFAVVKRFGPMARAGLLSFPRAGFTLMADFENRPANHRFFTSFTDFVLELGGRIYLAKDSYMLPRQFERMYAQLDQWRAIAQRYDPANRIRSDLSRRLGMKPW